MMNPKEKFLASFYTVLSNFEDETGVEIHEIKIKRVDVSSVSDAIRKTRPIQYDLVLK